MHPVMRSDFLNGLLFLDGLQRDSCFHFRAEAPPLPRFHFYSLSEAAILHLNEWSEFWGALQFKHLAGLWLVATACDSLRLLPDSGTTWKSVAKKNTSFTGQREAERYCYAAFRLRDRFVRKAAILSKLLASTAAPTHNSKRLRPSSRQRFMPRPRNSTEMVPSMPARKRCPLD